MGYWTTYVVPQVLQQKKLITNRSWEVHHWCYLDHLHHPPYFTGIFSRSCSIQQRHAVLFPIIGRLQSQGAKDRTSLINSKQVVIDAVEYKVLFIYKGEHHKARDKHDGPLPFVAYKCLIRTQCGCLTRCINFRRLMPFSHYNVKHPILAH